MATIAGRGAGVNRLRLSDRRGAGDRGYEPARPAPRAAPAASSPRAVVQRILAKSQKQSLQITVPPSGSEGDDVVIDLGESVVRSPPRRLKPTPVRISTYTPNPRLYPGPSVKKTKKRTTRSSAEAGRRRRVIRGVPNPRLYRAPAPAAARSPRQRAVAPAQAAAAPPAHTPPGPAPPGPAPLDTASRAALRLAQRRLLRPSSPPTPEGGRGMAEAEGAAPSELLAEFLSATLRRQYGAALECCRLILHYEPHNATARAFYPLLRHRLRNARPCRPNGPPHAPESTAGESDDSCSDNSMADLNGSDRHSGGGSSSGSSASLDSTSHRSHSNSHSHSNSNSGSSVDDNGNDADSLQPEDLENDNALPTDSSESAAAEEKRVLSELRARFACSIK